jgi:hypothetical protein
VDGRTVRSTCFSVSFLTRRSSIHDQTAVRKRSVKLMTRTLSCICSRAPPELIEAAYRVLAKQHHPDAGGDTVTMQRLNTAYAVLKAQVVA